MTALITSRTLIHLATPVTGRRPLSQFVGWYPAYPGGGVRFGGGGGGGGDSLMARDPIRALIACARDGVCSQSSDDANASLNTLRGRISTAMRSASSWNARPASLSGSTAAIGLPVVAAGAQRRHQRQLGEQRDVELGGQLGAAAGAEQLVALAVVAGEPRHVLDDAADR